MKQDLHQVSDDQIYPIGFKYPITHPLDLRAFRYGSAGSAMIPDIGAKIALTQHVAFAVVANALAGVKIVVVTVGAGDGKAHNGAIAANELSGGYIVIYPAVTNQAYRALIVANTAVLAGGGVMAVTLDKPLPIALTAVSHAECMANPYLALQSGNFPRQPVMGMPCLPATMGQFLWFQTWGPSWCAPAADVGVGDHNVEVVFRHDGSIGPHDYNEGLETKQQHAGFVMSIPNGAGQGAPFIFLQITP